VYSLLIVVISLDLNYGSPLFVLGWAFYYTIITIQPPAFRFWIGSSGSKKSFDRRPFTAL